MSASWAVPTSGVIARAQHLNQFLTFHSADCVYTGASIASNPQATGTGTTSVAVPVTGISEISRVEIPLSSTGSPAPLTVTLRAPGTTQPGAPMITAAVPPLGAMPAPSTISVPLMATGLTSSDTYWLLITIPTVTSGNSWSWQVGHGTSAVVPNGANWATSNVTFAYTVFSSAVTGAIVNVVWDGDPASRWTYLQRNTKGQLTAMVDMVANTLGSAAQITYANNALIGAATS